MIASSAGSRSNAAIPPASMSASSPNGLTVDRSVTTRSGSPSWRMTRPAASVSTMSPRWTLSSIPPRSWRARIGAAIRALSPRDACDGRPPTWGCAGTAAAGTESMDLRGTADLATGAATRARDRPAPIASDGRSTVPTPTRSTSRSHPAVLHKLAILRDERTEPKKFREVVRELSWLLGYEALADVRVRPLEIRTPLEPMTARTSWASGSASCRSCGPAWGWSTRCSS